MTLWAELLQCVITGWRCGQTWAKATPVPRADSHMGLMQNEVVNQEGY